MFNVEIKHYASDGKESDVDLNIKLLLGNDGIEVDIDPTTLEQYEDGDVFEFHIHGGSFGLKPHIVMVFEVQVASNGHKLLQLMGVLPVTI